MQNTQYFFSDVCEIILMSIICSNNYVNDNVLGISFIDFYM